MGDDFDDERTTTMTTSHWRGAITGLALALGTIPVGALAQQAPATTDAPTTATAEIDEPDAPRPARPAGRVRNILEAQLGDAFIESGLPATARLSVYVADLESGERLADLESDEPRAVGTAAMLATGAASLELLGADHTWATTLEVAGAFEEGTRTFKGLVLMRGGGDPSFLARTSTMGIGDRKARLALLDDWARALRAHGIRKLDGRVVGDDTLFSGPALGPGWETSESAEWWSAEVRALTIHDGVLELDWSAGNKRGRPAKAQPWPSLAGFEIVSNVLVAQPGEAPRPIRHFRHAVRTEYHATGSLEPGARATTLATVTEPARWAAERLAASMRRAGITLVNPAPATRETFPAAEWPAAAARQEIARQVSPPLGVLLPRVVRDGSPLYAECFARAIALRRGLPASFAGGDEALTQWADEVGLARRSWLMADGSGLSSSTRLSARELAEVMRRAARGPQGGLFASSLATAGQPGTLASAHARQSTRMRGVGGIHRDGTATVGLLETATARRRLIVVVVLDQAGEDSVARRAVVDGIVDVIDDATTTKATAGR